jgi:hypothetical protein
MRRAIPFGSGLALALVLGGGSALATTLYRWVDAQGVVHYSDSPQPGAQKVQVQDAQTYKALPAPKINSSSSAGSSSDAAAHSYQCSIGSPTADQSFFNPESVVITISIAPRLGGGDRIQVTLDGNALPDSGAGDWVVQTPDRGAHTINATVQSPDGKTMCTAEPVTFNVERPSALSPQSPAHH